MAVVMARRWVCAGATRVGKALRRKHAWPRAAGLTAHQTLVVAQRRSPPITSCVAHVSVKRRRCPGTVPLGAQCPQTRFLVVESAPNSKKFPKARGSAPGPPAAHRAATVLRHVGAREKNARPGAGGHGERLPCRSTSREARKIFWGPFLGGTLHHLNLDPASSPEALPRRAALQGIDVL